MVLVLVGVSVVHGVHGRGHHMREAVHVHLVLLGKNHFDGLKIFQMEVLNIAEVFGLAEKR